MNPETTYSLPFYQTACGISDMLAHIMERYFTKTEHVDVSDRLCEGLMRAIISNAKLVKQDPENYDARAEIMWAGTLAHSGLIGMGREEDWGSHAIEHELSAIYDIAHGAGLSIIFPAWMKHVYRENEERFVQFAQRVMNVELPNSMVYETIMEVLEMPQWLKDAVFYEIYPQTFCDTNGDGIGDIAGIISKLDYVKSLGCNAIWLNPIFDSPFMDAGYDVRNYKLVAERYGTNDDLIELFNKAHEKGIKILLDLVPGHTSDQCEWFIESQKPEKNEFSNRYTWTDSVWEAPPQYKFVCGITNRDGNYLVNFFSSQPALNYGFAEITHPNWQLPPSHPDCQATVEAMKDVMRFWLDKGADGTQ